MHTNSQLDTQAQCWDEYCEHCHDKIEEDLPLLEVFEISESEYLDAEHEFWAEHNRKFYAYHQALNNTSDRRHESSCSILAERSKP